MKKEHTQFAGSIAEPYHQFLGPLLFEPYADDLARRIPLRQDSQVLEVAAGTGILTERLLPGLGSGGRLAATDLNPAMIELGIHHLGEKPPLEWRTADAGALPYPDAAFDVVACQFGVMFFPDKPLAARETARVLKPGGLWAFNVWDRIERNPIFLMAHEVATRFFPDNPPTFYHVPFSYPDPAAIRSLLDADFQDVSIDVVDHTSVFPSATDVARGVVEGTPASNEIRQRGGDGSLDQIVKALAPELAAKFGDRPIRTPMRALVVTARRR